MGGLETEGEEGSLDGLGEGAKHSTLSCLY